MSRPGKIRLAQPALDQAEAGAIADVLASGMLVQGAMVERFERAVAERCGRAFAVAVTNGTAALELALECLDVSGHEVIVPALTWPSPAHAALRVGGKVVLADVGARSFNLEPATAAAARSSGTKVAIAIDQFGVPADVPGIAAALPGVAIVEDAACAIGSAQGGRPCGSFGVISTLSFHPRKVLTTGEGGMLLTDEPSIAEQARTIRNHGQRAPGQFALAGPNLRMTEMQAAMGLCQLAKLEGIVARRAAIGARYREALAALPITMQAVPEGAAWNHQTFGVVLEAHAPEAVLAALAEANIEAGRLSYALSRLLSLATARGAGTPIAERIADRGIALPLHTKMSDDDVERVIGALVAALCC